MYNRIAMPRDCRKCNVAEDLGLGSGKLHACWMHSPEAPLGMVGLQGHGAEVPEMKWVAKLACTWLRAEARQADWKSPGRKEEPACLCIKDLLLTIEKKQCKYKTENLRLWPEKR